MSSSSSSEDERSSSPSADDTDSSSSSPSPSPRARRPATPSDSSSPSASDGDSSSAAESSESASSSQPSDTSSSGNSDSEAAHKRRARRERRHEAARKRKEVKAAKAAKSAKAKGAVAAASPSVTTIGGQKIGLDGLGVGGGSLLRWVIEQDRFQPSDEEAAKLAKIAAKIAEPIPEPEAVRTPSESRKSPREDAPASSRGPAKVTVSSISGGHAAHTHKKKKKTTLEKIKEGASLIGEAAAAKLADAKEVGAEKLELAKDKLADAKEIGVARLADAKEIGVARLAEAKEIGAAKLAEAKEIGAARFADARVFVASTATRFTLGARRLPRVLALRRKGPAPPQAVTGVPRRQPKPSEAPKPDAAAPGQEVAVEAPQSKAARKMHRKKMSFIGGGIVEQVPEIPAVVVPAEKKVPPVPAKAPPPPPSKEKPQVPVKTPPPVPSKPHPPVPAAKVPPVPSKAVPAIPQKKPPPPPPAKEGAQPEQKPSPPIEKSPQAEAALPSPKETVAPEPAENVASPEVKEVKSPAEKPLENAVASPEVQDNLASPKAAENAPCPVPAVEVAKEESTFTKNLGKSGTFEDILICPPRDVLRRVQSVRAMPNIIRAANAPKRMTKIASDAVIVLDNGSSFMKVGVAGEDMPRTVIPTVSGYVGQACVIGRPALLRDGLKISCPINPLNKEIDWDALMDMWDFVLTHELRVDPTEHPLLMTELPAMHETARARMAEILFEEFDIPALNISSPAVLSLYSQGKSTGVAVDCGNRLQIIPVVDGFAIDSATTKSRVGFANLTEYLSRILTERGYYFRTSREQEMVRKIKEETGYVALDFEAEMAKDLSELEMKCRLTNDKEITIGNERFRCTEAMFRPEMLGMDMIGIHRSLWNSIQHCPIDTRRSLLNNIVLAGGSTLFPGFQARLEKEIFSIAQESKAGLRKSDVNVISPKNRKYLAWVGGSVLGSTPNFVETNCLTSDQYFEEGYPGSQ